MTSYNGKKWKKKDGCDCWKCQEVECYEERYEKKWDVKDGCDCYECRENKIVINVDCNKEYDKKDDNKYDHDKKDYDKKHDQNKWIREILEKNFLYKEVTFFTEDSTHTEGIVSEVGKEFVKLVRGSEPIEVESNCESDEELEEFDLYFIRLDCICGFGRESDD